MASYYKANDFVVPAQDPNVARYLKNTKPARDQLVGVVRSFAFVTIETNGQQGMQYRFSQLKGKKAIHPESFAQQCESCLMRFLESYTTKKQTFPSGLIQKVEQTHPAFFQNNVPGIFIACYRDSNHVLFCGRREIVNEKIAFLSDHFNIAESATPSTASVAIQATDINVAMFLRNSVFHLDKMKKHMKHLGKVFIKVRDKHDVQYQVSTEAKKNFFDQKVFHQKCSDELKQFLKHYSTEKSFFDETSLAQAKRKFPDFFADLTAEKKQNLFVQWYPTQVVICGEKSLVDEKLKEVKEIVDCLAGSSSVSTGPHEFVKVAGDRHVGMFILKNAVHKTKIVDRMKSFAKVTLQSNKEGLIEFHCHPTSGMDQSTFEDLCDSVLSEFESDYTTEKVNFAAGTIANTNLPDEFYENNTQRFFERWYKENDHVILSGPRQLVHDRLSEIQKKIGPPLKRSTGRKTYSVAAPNKSVAMFIKKSAVHMRQLQDIIGGQGSIDIIEKDKEYMFTCSTDLEMDTFEEYFKTLLLSHLDKYDMKKLFYDSEDISRAYKQNSDFFDTSKCDETKFYIHWYRNAKSSNVVLIGLKDDIEAKEKEIESFFKRLKITGDSSEETNEHCDKEDCKLLLKCEILKKTNKEFSGRLKISCFPDDERLIFIGSPRDIQEAKIYIDSLKKKLTSKQPKNDLHEAKIIFLQEMLEKHPLDAENRVQTIFSQHHVKGVLMHKNPDGLTLVATSQSHFQTGCKALESIVHCLERDIPPTLPDSALKGSKWREFMARQVAFHQLHAVVRSETIYILGFEKNKVATALHELDRLLDNILDNSVIFKCTPSKASLVEDGFKNKRFTCPMSISIKKVSHGVEICGSKVDVQLVLSKIKSMTWHERLISYQASNLSTYTQTNSWKSFIQEIWEKHACAVDVLNSTTGSAADSTSSEQIDSEIFVTKPTSTTNETCCWYGSLAVCVSLGDIAKQSTMAIVNGCVKSFNLQQGALSPYILKCAGPEMQTDIIENPLYESSTCRVTDSYRLPCKMVIHVVTPKNGDDLVKTIRKALDVAEKMMCTSIAFPTLGSGGIGLPIDVVAKSMSKAFEQFASQGSKHLKKILLVVFESTILPDFVDAVRSQVQGSYQQHSKVTISDLLKKQKEEMNKNLETMTLTLTADQRPNILEAETAIQKHMDCLKHEIQDDIIQKMDEHATLDIIKEAVKYKAIVVFEKTKITIDDPLLMMTDTSHQSHSKFSEYVRRYLSDLTGGVLLAKTCVWQYRDNGDIVTLPPAKSFQLEKQLEKNCKSFSLQLHGKPTSVNLEKMKITTENDQHELLRTVESDLPPEWKICDKPVKIRLETTDPEYQKVLAKFRRNAIPFQVTEIQRLQNPGLYRQFKIKEREVRESMKNTQQVVVRELFHGTSFEDADKICKEGFDRSFAGKNATAYGRGVYFAADSAYSSRYCRADALGRKAMFLANIITGEYCVGHRDMKVPPEKPGLRSRYDSTVDNENNPRIFVVYKDSSAYASYLITFI